MNVEDSLDSLGKFGKWHITHFIILSTFQSIAPAFQMLAIIWIGHTPEHHCRTAEGVFLNHSIPHDFNGKLSQCLKYVNLTLSNQTMACDDGWVYDPADSYTIVNKWDLVCDNKFYSQLPQTILVLGVMIGAFFSSVLSDKFGRKPVFMAGQMMMVAVGVVCAVVNNYYVFLCLRFITGMLQQTILLSGFILLSEMFSSKQRTFASMNVNCFWGFSAGLLAFLAFLIHDWVHLQLVISLIGLLSIPLFCFISESVPWLYANGRIEEAEKTIRNAAKMNKIQMPDEIFVMKHKANLEKNEGKVKNFVERLKVVFIKKKSNSHHYSTQYSLLDLFKNRKLALYLTITSFMWIVITLVYYGLTLTTGDMEGNRFINGFQNGIIEVPAYILSYFLITKFGRKKPLFSLFTLVSVSLCIIPFIPKTTSIGTDLSYLSRIFNILGKFGITGCFGILFLYVAELFPTNLRNQAIGICSFFGRLGNISATFTIYVLKIYPALPMLSFAGLSFIAALLVLSLPETHHRPLPNTIEEIESWTNHVEIHDEVDKNKVHVSKMNEKILNKENV